jgi:hypothetical protein
MHRLTLVVAAGTAAAMGCGDRPRVTLEPVRIEGSSCGRPDGATGLVVTALGELPETVRAVPLGEVVDITDFPAGTRQIEVSVLGPAGTAAFGRTAPFALDALDDGAVLPIFMAPPDDGCPVTALGEARDRPLVIAAGDGALVVGGQGADGPLGTAEWYDPARGTFEAIDTPQALRGPRGAAGMVSATLPDGRVVLTGGDRPVFVVFDPATRTFVRTGALFELRAHHASVAIDERRVLVAGGCGMLDDLGLCVPGSERRRSFVIDVEAASEEDTIVDGPDLAIARVDGVAIREPGAVLLVGGRDEAGVAADAERIDPFEPPGGAGGQVLAAQGAAAPLISGATLVGFAPDGAAASGVVSVVVPGGDVRVEGTFGVRAGATLTPLEDGGVLVVGGDDVAPVARYLTVSGNVATQAVDPLALDGAPLGRAGHGAARLADGTVLVVGGRDAGGAPVDGAWVYRPSGDSPFTGAVTVTPGDIDAPLVPLDPAAVAPLFTLSGADGLGPWAVIGGMRPRELDATASLMIADGGVALLVGFVDAEHFDRVELREGAPARWIRRDVTDTERCGGEVIANGELGGGDRVDVAASVRDEQLTVSLGGRVVLACAIDDARAGLVGLAALDDSGTVTLSTISVVR